MGLSLTLDQSWMPPTYIPLCITYFIEPEAKKSKAGAKKNEKEAVGEGTVLYEDPPDQKTSPSGKSATLKICSWNVDGLRAWIKKKGLDVSGIKGVQRLSLGFNHLFPS